MSVAYVASSTFPCMDIIKHSEMIEGELKIEC